MSRPTVAVVGASKDRSKYGNKSVRAHQRAGYEVFPVNPKDTEIEGLAAYASLADIPAEQLDRVTIYVPPHIGIGLLEQLSAKPAREVWFNPGSESREIIERARQLQIDVIAGCSIVDLGFSPAEFPG